MSPIYIFEPSALSYPDSSLRHQQFVYHSIIDMNAGLQVSQRTVVVFYAETMDVCTFLCEHFSVAMVFSYQESGIRDTWNRDKQIAQLLQAKGIQWREFQRDDIIRGIKNRDAWDKQWYVHVNGTMFENQLSVAPTSVRNIEHPYSLPQVVRGTAKKLSYASLFNFFCSLCDLLAVACLAFATLFRTLFSSILFSPHSLSSDDKFFNFVLHEFMREVPCDGS